MNDDVIKSASLDEIREMDLRGELHHNPNALPGPDLGVDFWDAPEVELPESKVPISLRVDRDLLDWFKAGGNGYQTRMNAVLRSYMNASQLKKAG